jgi:hyperosmotically inducible protein
MFQKDIMANIEILRTGLFFALVMSVAALAGCQPPEAVPPNGVAAAPTTVGMEIDDTVTTAKVKSALLSEPDVKAFAIKVETRKGMVLLSGFVDNEARAERAISVAREVAGVKAVENGMTVKDGNVTVGNKVDDGIVTARVKSALLSEPTVKSNDITVVTRKGEVQLSGFVDNQAQIERAADVTRAVEGVRTVANEMSVKK